MPFVSCNRVVSVALVMKLVMYIAYKIPLPRDKAFGKKIFT